MGWGMDRCSTFAAWGLLSSERTDAPVLIHPLISHMLAPNATPW